MEEKNLKNSTHLPKVISGIDTLYYFYESNENYPNFFADILQQLEDNKKQFNSQKVAYENKDLKVTINKHIFDFSGRAQGFYWFNHFENFFSVGLKDSLVNVGVHDIQTQLNAIGIYKLGLKSLLHFADEIFKNLTTGYKPVTRADLNIFVQSDLSWLHKDMFVSRKRKYATHSKEVSSKYRLQTLYIGQVPFKLRLYDKQEELKSSSKKEMMYQYFKNNGLSVEDEIFNIEFELHRKFMRSYSIDSVDDLLIVAETLFKECMSAIRLVALESISANSIQSSNRYKAQTHPLWQYISDSYRLKEFLSSHKPLLKIKRPKYCYTVEEAIQEHIKLAHRVRSLEVVVDEQFYSEVLTGLGKVGTTNWGLYLKNKGLASESAVGCVR